MLRAHGNIPSCYLLRHAAQHTAQGGYSSSSTLWFSKGNQLINSPFSALKLVSGREEVSGKEGGIAGRDLYQGALLQ